MPLQQTANPGRTHLELIRNLFSCQKAMVVGFGIRLRPTSLQDLTRLSAANPHAEVKARFAEISLVLDKIQGKPTFQPNIRNIIGRCEGAQLQPIYAQTGLGFKLQSTPCRTLFGHVRSFLKDSHTAKLLIAICDQVV